MTIFASPQIHAFLNSFRADPLTGTMIIPCLEGNSTNQDDWSYSAEPVSVTHHTEIAQSCRQLYDDAAALLNEQHDPDLAFTVPYTNGEWRLEIEDPDTSALCFFDGHTPRLWDEINLHIDSTDDLEIAFVRGAPYREAAMCYVSEGGEPKANHIYYNLLFQNLGLVSLRRYCNLPNDISLEGLRAALLKMLGLPDSQVSKAHHDQQELVAAETKRGAGQDRLQDLRGRLQMELGKHIFSINIEVNPIMGGFCEHLDITVAGTADNPLFSLPQALQGLFTFAASSEGYPAENQSLHNYYAQTRRIYGDTGPRLS